MADPRKTYYEILTEAIADLTANGFDSAERVAYWQMRIKEAAERSMRSMADTERMLREALMAVYTRLVDKGAVAKYHPGVSRFTIDKLRPILRGELDRRILASADLIKLNRQQSIAKTLQRFSGWASSIPAGGSKVVKKGEEKQNIRKALTQLPFEERRVIIDQGHKLSASISEVIAKDGGAIAVMWRSNWRQANYNYRHNHKERDGKVYLMRDSWAKKSGFVKAGKAGYYDEITAVGEEPFCRCFAVWIYNLRDLPEDMLTVKGKNELEAVRKRIAEL